MSAARVAAACGAVLFLCLAIWRLRSGRPARAALGAGVAALLAVYAGGGTFALPDGERAVEDAAEALGGWTYPFVALMAFVAVFYNVYADREGLEPEHQFYVYLAFGIGIARRLTVRCAGRLSLIG